MKIFKSKLYRIGRAVLLLVLLVLFYAQLRKSTILSEEKFVEVYVQLAILSEKYPDSGEKYTQEKNRIMDKYRVTSTQLENFRYRFQKHPEKWVLVWNKIAKKLDRLRQQQLEVSQ